MPQGGTFLTQKYKETLLRGVLKVKVSPVRYSSSMCRKHNSAHIGQDTNNVYTNSRAEISTIKLNLITGSN